MGIRFGELAKIRNIVFFRLSPHEQKAFAGIISDGVPNMIRRIDSKVYRIAPFMIFTYLLMKWAKEENMRISRKNPKDFENDV